MRQLPIACTVLLVLAACQSPVGVADSGPTAQFNRSPTAPVHIVSLAGKLDLSAYGIPDETYAMTAHKDADGAVSGHITVKGLNGEISFTGDVTCLQVQDNLAWVGVHITRSDASSGPYGEGGGLWFRLQDNGEGADAPVDRISSLNPNGGAARCNEKRVGLSLAWEMQGNVQVR